jgi:hypothetical protein
METLAAKIDRLVERFEARKVEGPVPEWILPPPSCEFLESLASLLPPPVTAFEFGSGKSTHALRRACAETISVDNSAEWLRQTETLGQKKECDHSFVIPLRRRWNRLRLIESFDLKGYPQILDWLRRSNLILVDSPPNPVKREDALFLALQHAPVGALILLDDLEVRTVARFGARLARQNADAFRFWTVAIDHRLGLFLKMQSRRVRSLPSLREFVGTWLRA